MAKTAAERMRKYRQNLKQKGLASAKKNEDRIHKQVAHSNLTGKEKLNYQQQNKKHQANYRNRKTKNIASIPPVYKSKQTFSKALKKVITALPKDISKQREIIKRVSETLGLTPKTTHKRTTPTLTVKTKQDVIQLYQRDDISWQAPGKRDTIVVRQN
ncbi:unnamed protein product, partial [Didymodactylos carnosus]